MGGVDAFFYSTCHGGRKDETVWACFKWSAKANSGYGELRSDKPVLSLSPSAIIILFLLSL